ncbi:hypothetical protein V565_320990 [Rhizoctonia solani 123E]|uniref:Uncharacterized protein n=1 Tax=Rhizoctonia solani 123E TaxID=1423351 RepID=A0A074RK24_9AGAM|nr:hypothetical protein V565_320990 [Rhizoctonia solani 123E]
MFALTCHHVVLKVDATHNKDYSFEKDSGPCKNVQLLGTHTFDKLVKSIDNSIKSHQDTIEDCESWIMQYEMLLEGNSGHNVAVTTKRLKRAWVQLEDATEAIEDLQKFHAIVNTDWGHPEQCIIGHIHCSLPLLFGVQPDGFTQDWAVIDLDKAKFCEFKGNFIDLGTEKDCGLITSKMYPCTDGSPLFKYPKGRLLPVCGMISEQLMHEPNMHNKNREHCLLVIKNSNRTGVIIGCATGIESFVHNEGTNQCSKEWAVFNYDCNSLAFFHNSDSGSMVIDRLGLMGSILHRGAGKTESSNVSYIIPMCKLWPWFKAVFTKAQFYHQDTAY